MNEGSGIAGEAGNAVEKTVDEREQDGTCSKNDLTEITHNAAIIDPPSDREEDITTSRRRKLTSKGLMYHVDIKTKNFNSKRNELVKQIRQTLLLRGQCREIQMWKHELSKAQILWAELGDIYGEIQDLNCEDERVKKVEIMLNQVEGEWLKFEETISSEIQELVQLEQLQVRLEVASSASVKSRRTNRSDSSKASSRSSSSSYSTKQLKVDLQQSEASLKTKLAFSAEERKLMIWKLECEQKAKLVELENTARLQQLRLERELAENQAKLKACIETENEEFGFQAQDFESQFPSNKEEDMNKFFSSTKQEEDPLISTMSHVPNTTSTAVFTTANLTTAVENTSLTTSLQASPIVIAPTGIARVTGSYRESTTSSTKDQLNPQVEAFVPISTTKGTIMSTGTAVVHAANAEVGQEQDCCTSPENGWERIASSLERCMEKLVLTSMEQNKVNTQLTIASQLPKINVPVFSGNALEYPMWNNSFCALIESKPMNSKMKLNFLNQYVSGDPKKIVEHFLLIGTEEAYEKAKTMLRDRYGNSNIISTAFIKKLEDWPRIGPREAVALREFSDFLEKILAAWETVPSLSVLDFAKENVKLLAKLPYHVEVKWRDIIIQWRTTHGESSFPPFSKFAEFMKQTAEKANIPELDELSKGKLNSRFNRPQGGNVNQQLSKNLAATSFVTTGKQPTDLEDGDAPSGDSDSVLLTACLFCGKDHLLDDCKDFAAKSFKERKQFFFDNHLCMGCASSKQHIWRDCDNKKRCKICSGAHPTCLHLKSNEKGVTNCTSVCSLLRDGGTDHSMIVPVWVRPAGQPTEEVLQYAVLDDQSNVSFVSNSLCDRLGLSGPSTQLLLTTVQEKDSLITSNRIEGLEVLDYNKEHVVQLPMLFQRDIIPALPSQIPRPEVVREWEHLKRVADELMPYDSSVEISLLIGNNCPRIVRPREVIAGNEDDPYGQRSLMGWGVIGNMCKSRSEDKGQNAVCNKVQANETYQHFSFPNKVKEVFDSNKVLRALEADFVETSPNGRSYSTEDVRFLNVLDNGIKKRPDGHYEMPLPLKSENISLPNNRQLADKRWKQLQARFRKNPKYFADYKNFMEEVVVKYAERVPEQRLDIQDGRINYVPHTGVYHPRKLDQIRVVFDCSAKFHGVSLNDHLLQGPDMTNGLLGVLCRFRQEKVAIMADIKSMFHQFYVTEEHRDLLRFLWWEDGDTTKDVVEYRMKVHLFGAGSSPGCANYGLKKAADDGTEEFGSAAASFIRKDFYVDDGLKSLPTVQEAISLINSTRGMCAKAGLKLHKISSNEKEVLQAIPMEERAKRVKDLNLDSDPLPVERALGITWCVANDCFQFRIELRDRPFTRRGILSTVSSIYDPNGYVAPVTLRGKQILQQLCKERLEWDSPIPDDLHPAWEKWRKEILQLDQLLIPRCFKPKSFGKVETVELHHFSDASERGYGQCSYLRQVNEQGKAHCAFVIGKARVTPLKQVTMPRLELAAATVSAKMSEFLKNELSHKNIVEFFWTDSKIVLGYVSNDAKRFQVYVANRIQQIRDRSHPNSWHHVETQNNPADDASRGLTVNELVNESRWLKGPRFLWEDGEFIPQLAETIQPNELDPELKKATTLTTGIKKADGAFPDYFETDRLKRFSSWTRATRVVALCLKLKAKLTKKGKEKPKTHFDARINQGALWTVEEVQEAKEFVIKSLQTEHFRKELEALGQFERGGVTDRKTTRERNKIVKQYSSLFQLDPFVDGRGLLRVGGRIKRANMSTELKHPLIIPRKSHITELLIRHFHHKVNHMGRGITHNEIRQQGYWIVGGSAAVSNYISHCVTCRKLRGKLQKQKMADLPEDRLQPEPPFSYCAVDYFGPFLIKERRSQVKRYGVIFTCMASRSVHLETANALDTSSFINALRRFLSRRGPVRQIRSDQGTNFVGARNELKAAFDEMDQQQVERYLLANECEWIPFDMNVPHSSHMGGVWERLIRTVRRALEILLNNAGSQLNDEAFRTFMTEVEGIVNSRPLTTDNLCSPDAPEPLTPNHLLTMKPKILLPPPGNFQSADLYSRKWWRRVQYLCNEFWFRWRREFLNSLQTRHKWIRPVKNLVIGDIVISKEETQGPRNQWPMAKVVEVYPSKDGHVRTVKLLIASDTADSKGRRQQRPTFLDRPIHKLVLLVAEEDEENRRQQGKK